MAATKAIVFALLAVFAVAQCHTAVQRQEVERGLAEDLAKLVDRIISVVEGAIQTIAETVAAVSTKLGELVDQVLKNVDGILGGVKNQIDELIAKAQQAGKDVTDCIKASDAGFDKIREDAKASVQSCHDAGIAEVDKVVASAKAEVEKIEGIAKGWVDKFNACVGLVCKGGVLVEATTKVPGIVLEVTGLIAKTTGVIVGVGATGTACLAKVGTAVSKQGIELAAEIATCITNK